MWLDGLDNLEGNEGGSEWWTEQQSEASKSKAAKSLAGIQKTQKDEKKAQRDNDYLHLCLREIIASQKYDTIIPYIFPLFDVGIPSHIIIGSFSLIDQKSSNIIRDHYVSEMNRSYLDEAIMQNSTHSSNIQGIYAHRAFNLDPFESPIEFDDQTVDTSIRKRINEWVEDIFTVVSHDPSTVMTERFLHILAGKEKKDVIELLWATLIFFLLRVNVHISLEKASIYSDFILKEVAKKLKKLQLESIDI